VIKIEYKLDERPYKIAALTNEDKQVISFVVCDRNLERINAKSFYSVSLAMNWADDNFVELVG